MFAKLYGAPDDQVLVKIDRADDGPEVRFYFEPKGLGICSFALGFPDTDAGWGAAESVFDAVDESKAREAIVKAQCQMGVDISAFASAASEPNADADLSQTPGS